MAKTVKDFNEQFKKTADIINELKKASENTLDKNKQLAELQDVYANKQQLINDMLLMKNKLTAENKTLLNELVAGRTQELLEINKLKKANSELADVEKNRKNIQDKIVRVLKEAYKYLMDQDRIIRTTIISLGMSGQKAELIRESFERTAATLYSLGGNLEDLLKIQTGYADETGRALNLSTKQIQAIAEIGKGTNIGIEAAAQLAGQFSMIGVDAFGANKRVQSIVDTSEKMGLNTTKIIKSMIDNFKKAQTFTFKGGTKALAEMAISAENTRVSMETAFNIVESTRKLENVIELGANLQVMGGEFSKMDTLSWLYTVRNEPEKLNEQISLMTRGLYTLKRNSEGVFEPTITPADADRMRFVAKQLNMSNEALAEIAKKRLILDKIGYSLKGLGFTKEQEEWVAGAAQVNKKTGQYQVKVGETLVNIRDLTQSQAQSFVQEQSLLKQRAQDNITFNEQIQVLLSQLKSTLLPLLRGLNYILKPMVEFSEWFGKQFQDKKGGWATGIVAGMTLLAAGFVGLKLAMLGLQKASLLFGKGPFVKGLGKSNTLTSGRAIAQGKGRLLGGIGTAAAAIGIGTGIMLAAKGISALADSLNKLNDKQASALKGIAMTLAISLPAAAAGMVIFGKAALASSEGIALVTGAALGLGAAIGIAAAGIGVAGWGISKMTDSLGNLIKNAKGSGKALIDVGKGVAALMLSLNLSGGIIGMVRTGTGILMLKSAINVISKESKKLTPVADTFKNLSNILSGNYNLNNINSGFNTLSNSIINFTNKSKELKTISELFNSLSQVTSKIVGFEKLGTEISSLSTIIGNFSDKSKNLQSVKSSFNELNSILSQNITTTNIKTEFDVLFEIINKLSKKSSDLSTIGNAFSNITIILSKNLDFTQAINGLNNLSHVFDNISKKSVELKSVGDSFKNISNILSGNFGFSDTGKKMRGLARTIDILAEKSNNLKIVSGAFTDISKILAGNFNIGKVSNDLRLLSKNITLITENSKNLSLVGDAFKYISDTLSENFGVIKTTRRLRGLSKTIDLITRKSGELKIVGDSFNNISTALSGNFGFNKAMTDLNGLSKTIDILTAKTSELKIVGDTFKNISTVLSGNENDYAEVINLVETISKINTSKSNIFTELAELMKKPLKVEFADKTINLRNNITLELDGKEFMNKAYNVQLALTKHVAAMHKAEGK